MEGIYFYWVMWLAWIISTFLMKKDKNRLYLSAFILITILLSKMYVIVNHYNVRLSLVLFLLFGYLLAVKQNKHNWVSFYMTTLTFTFAYSGLLLFRIYDPVWFIIDYRIIISLIISLLAIYLSLPSVHKYSVYIISVCQGEVLYGLILGKFHKGITVGTSGFLDIVVIGCSVIFVSVIAQEFLHTIERTLQKPSKEKQG